MVNIHPTLYIMMQIFSDLPPILALVRAKNCAWLMPTGSDNTSYIAEVFFGTQSIYPFRFWNRIQTTES